MQKCLLLQGHYFDNNAQYQTFSLINKFSSSIDYEARAFHQTFLHQYEISTKKTLN